jgi:hypothetical protein
MTNITITDKAGLSADVELRDNSLLGQSKLMQLLAPTVSLLAHPEQPINQIAFRGAALSAKFNSPALSIASGVDLAITAGVNGALSIVLPSDQTLFGPNDFVPAIPLAADECWMGFELDAFLSGQLGATVNGFGAGIAASSKLGLTTYILFKSTSAGFPSFKSALTGLLNGFSANFGVDDFRRQLPRTVNVTELSGSITFSGSYSLPANVHALASSDLPFNYKIDLNPGANLTITGGIALSGEFVVRSHKISATELQLGIYKKKGSTLTATFTAGVGVEADLSRPAGTQSNAGANYTDLISAFFKTALPGVRPEQAGIVGDRADALRGVLNGSIDRSLSIAMNVACSAATTDEASVVYLVDLGSGDQAKTDAALGSALKGNWTQIDSLPNARALRNVFRETHDFQHSININLLGVYNAKSLIDYVNSCKILHDDDGQIVIVDRVKASEIEVASKPDVADRDKLRAALSREFLSTVTYAAGAGGPNGGKLNANISVSQAYFRYARQLNGRQMRDELLLGAALGIVQPGSWDGILVSTSNFGHVSVGAMADYDTAGAMHLFFADPANRTPYTRSALESIGRKAMAALIEPSDPGSTSRLLALSSNPVWNAMDEIGNSASFRQIPEINHLNVNELAVIAADWIDIRWWADAMLEVAPKLSDMLVAVEHSTAVDPTTDPEFMKRREALAHVLGAVARNTRSAFAGGWGLAVMAAVSGGAAKVSLDIGWNSQTRHYQNGQMLSAGAPAA